MAVAEGWQEDQALALALAVEGDSEHLIARGIRQRQKMLGQSPTTSATGRSHCAAHALTSMVFPNPARAEISVSPSFSRSIRRARTIAQAEAAGCTVLWIRRVQTCYALVFVGEKVSIVARWLALFILSVLWGVFHSE